MVKIPPFTSHQSACMPFPALAPASWNPLGDLYYIYFLSWHSPSHQTFGVWTSSGEMSLSQIKNFVKDKLLESDKNLSLLTLSSGLLQPSSLGEKNTPPLLQLLLSSLSSSLAMQKLAFTRTLSSYHSRSSRKGIFASITICMLDHLFLSLIL